MQRYVTACVEEQHYCEPITELAAWASHKLKAPLRLVHVMDDDDIFAEPDLSHYMGLGAHEELVQSWTDSALARSHNQIIQSQQLLDELQIKLKSQGLTNISQQYFHGHLIDTLKEHDLEIRTLVLGKSGHTNDAMPHHIGHHIEPLLRTLDIHTLIASNEFIAPHSFMLAFDGSPHAEDMLDKVIASPILTNLTCHLVMVHGHHNEYEAFERATHRLVNAGFNVFTAHLDGDLPHALTDYQLLNDIHLLVMGAYSHSKIHNMMFGSHTTRILNDTDISVMILK
ncbi:MULTISPECIES: universal stress protein [Vibrio]|uniref:UspA domain-containing protein n=2 Tax=Vibrio TaxID=662 RepID=A0A7X4LNV5_9VIBR|nr:MULTISPECIES: universal stress protein [Vibrio]MBF9002282.1 universal stress protein [Vibrio nitrifigilis]MZI94936.1 hypothetical protein [Vibrio eleionomae]